MPEREILHSLKIKSGSTLIGVADGPDKNYKTSVQRIVVGTIPVNIKFELGYTDQKLNALLSDEQPEVVQVLGAAFPAQMRQFDVRGGKFYHDGSWYAAKLVPHDASQDTYRVVLNKQAGRWVVATKPPRIVLSSPVFPNIPKDILSDVNNF